LTTEITGVQESGRKMSARRDILLIVVIAIVAAFVCAKYNVSETLLNWTRPLERWQLDEVPGVLLVVAICLIWFSSRRYFEADRQLRLRRKVEARLAEALAENQLLAQQYADMQETERKALARDLHDELGQYLNAIKLDAVSIRDSMTGHGGGPDVVRAMIVNIDRVYGAVAGLIRQLRPVAFDDLGVSAALEHCVNEWRSRLPRTVIELSIDDDFEALGESRALVMYRLVQEALTNIARHAHATRVEIRIAPVGSTAGGQSGGIHQHMEIVIADNGGGADLRSPRTGLGLVGMRERVLALGGSITLQSERGAGFKVVAILPFAAEQIPAAGSQS
jgi:two-component system, NarL family, sensor histidine kinase UhpB